MMKKEISQKYVAASQEFAGSVCVCVVVFNDSNHENKFVYLGARHCLALNYTRNANGCVNVFRTPNCHMICLASHENGHLRERPVEK